MSTHTDTTEQLNTDKGIPERLNFLRRFIFQFPGLTILEVERQTTGPLMTPLMSARERIPKMLSTVAKPHLPSGAPARDYREKLPPIDVAAIFISQHQHQQPNATASIDEFPYKLKAVGRVDAMAIFNRAGQPGELISPVVQVVP